MTTPHRTRLILRGHQPLAQRDPNISRVYVASEDTHACEKYLLALQAAGLIDPARIEVLPLPTLDGHSTLAAVLRRLDTERAEPGIRLSSDEYWEVFDIDRQTREYLDAQARIAHESAYHLAGSNPCFELWLLLHLTADLHDLPVARTIGAPVKSAIAASMRPCRLVTHAPAATTSRSPAPSASPPRNASTSPASEPASSAPTQPPSRGRRRSAPTRIA